MNNICGVVILYYPPKEVEKNISTYIESLDRLYIINNSKTEIPKHSKIQILYNGENIGVAKALNLALKEAKKDGFKYLFTFDQDSYFYNNDINIFLENFLRCKSKNKNIAIFSPIHNPKFIEPKFQEVDFVMTSANLVNIDIALEIGGYREDFFIDEIDHEFCFRLKKNRYKIVQDKTIAISHKLGNKGIYPSKRLYYMLRNYLYLRKEYQNEEKEFFKKRDKYLIKFFLKHLILNIFNLKMVIKSIVDYKKGKKGELK